MNAYEPDGRDPGLAAERTDLAWSRSGLSLLALGAVVLRGIGRPPLPAPDVAAGASLLLLGTATWFLGAWHTRHRRRRGTRTTILGDLVPITVGVAAIGVAAFVVAAASG
jgi:uncharacterized membrane protein YidH (DUF202 family)